MLEYKDSLMDELHEQKDTPHWTDHCRHPEGSYLGSILSFNNGKEEWLDIYVYEDRLSHEGLSVCIRYGNEGSDYYSPGSILNVIRHSGRGDRPSDYALHIMRKKGVITYVRNIE